MFVLADLDGVLVDSGASVRAAWDWWARSRRIEPQAIHGAQHGRPSREVVAAVAPHLDPSAESAAIDSRQAERTEGVQAIPGARELLTLRPDRVAVVTSCTPRLAAARLGAGKLPRPRVMVTADDVTAGKPDPEGYLLAARLLGGLPAHCVVIEDSPAGVAAGLAAGIKVIGVTSTHEATQLTGVERHVRDLRGLAVELLGESLGESGLA